MSTQPKGACPACGRHAWVRRPPTLGDPDGGWICPYDGNSPPAEEPAPKAPGGGQYVAQRRLSTKDNKTLAEVGDTCERVPEGSLPWLIERGWIVPKGEE